MENLLQANELSEKISREMDLDIKVHTIRKLRREGVLKGVDKRTPGSKRASWRYPEKENIETLKKLQKESK